jgi:SulP family sulfate permease
MIQAIRLLQVWGVATRQTLPRAEWLLVIAIILITAWFGFIPAEVTGLLAACVLFALSVSRIDVVRAIYGLDARNSSVVWPDDETRYLAAHGASVQVIELRGFVFFGSAHRLRERVKSIVAELAPVMLIFDFSRVIGIDSSAATAMVRISCLLHESGIQQTVVGLSPGGTRSVSESGSLDRNVVILADIDEALERGETAVLATRAMDSAATPTFHDWIAAVLGGPDYAEVLQQQLVATHHEPGHFCADRAT